MFNHQFFYKLSDSSGLYLWLDDDDDSLSVDDAGK